MIKREKNSPGRELDSLLKRLFPICRSITGNGVRETLSILAEHLPLKIHEVRSGTKVFDWTVPKEWNIWDAYIKDPSGKKIVDFKKNNLHVMGYSTPVRKMIKLAELKKHLYSLPEHPRFIPYKTSYYKEKWGFCLPHKQLKSLKEGTYEVVVDSSLRRGSLTYGELLIPGKSKDEVLISSYICHPSMGNDSLSGVVMATFLALSLQKKKGLRYSYRFLFIPETIGAITWLAKNSKSAKRVKHGLVATCLGDSGPFTYKRTRAGNTAIDRAAEKALIRSGVPYSLTDFFPWGSDERQFNSPGFNLPVGSLMRSVYGTYPQYHSSGDDLTFVSGKNIAQSLALYLDIIDILEHDIVYRSRSPYGEAQLGKRGLYGAGGSADPKAEIRERALLWLLAYADGTHALSEIAARSGIDQKPLSSAAMLLQKHRLLERL